MDGDDERGAKRSEEPVGRHVVAPLVVRSAPTETQDVVELLDDALALVTHRGDVRNQADEEEHRRDGQVGVDGEHVPQERGLEVRPQQTLVRVREQEVDVPEATDVNHREERRGDDREDGHRLGRPVDAGAEARSEEEQNRADEGTGVTDTDPEHEGRDVHAPEHRRVVPGDAHAVLELVGPAVDAEAENTQVNQEDDGPESRRLEERTDDVLVDLCVGRSVFVATHQ